MSQPQQRVTSFLSGLMPRGTPLPDEDWSRRHGTISAIAALHVPAVFVYALLVDATIVHALVETAPVALFALLGRRSAAHRTLAEMATTLALVSSSAILVHLSGGYIEMHFHFFVVVALVTLYQQWSPFLLAIGFVIVHHGVAGVLEPTSVYNHPAAIASPWNWAAIHGTFIAMASAVGMANWKLNELARHRAEDYFRRLYEGELAVVQRLEDADRLKSELVAAVSHEFRTPLTVVLGLTRTLSDPAASEQVDVADFAGRIHRQGRRLEQLVDNLLQAERPIELGGWCDAGTAIDAAIEVARRGPHRSVTDVNVAMETGQRIALSQSGAQVVLSNLLTNAFKFAEPGTVVDVVVHPLHTGGTVIEVSNHGPPVLPHLSERIFEPFVQGDSSDTRAADGVGLGLHLVQRIVTANGGRVTATSSEGVTTFSVWLPPQPDRVPSGVSAKRPTGAAPTAS